MTEWKNGLPSSSPVASRRWLHRGSGDNLHQVVDHNVPQRTHRVIEMTTVLNPEALRHRDQDTIQIDTAPERLEDRVGEPQMQDFLEPIFPR